MNIVRHTVITALLGLGAPTALIAQLRVSVTGFSITIQGQQQGTFPGTTKEGITGLRFSHMVVSPRDVASGLPSGKRQHRPVVFTKTVGTASPQIFKALVANEGLPSVVVTVPGGYTIKLTNASVSEVKQYTEVINGAVTVLEDVSFTYQKIEVRDPTTGAVAVDDWESPQT